MKTKDFHPRVSIVIPVYNGSNYLAEAIDSALAQSYGNIEIIVINDGSTDDGSTEEIAKSYGDRIHYYKKQNGGVASALNLGIQKMTGDYFSWLSHDDMYERTKIEKQLTLLEKLHKKDIIVACNAKVLFANGIKKKEKIDANTFSFIDIFLSTSADVGLNGCALLIPKNAFVMCGDFNVDLPVTQDYDLWFRMKDTFKFILLEKFLVISRRHEEQDSVKKQSILFEAGDELHYQFLNTIPFARFNEYFKSSKNNIGHTYKNYQMYKSRGYKKTASVMLKKILKYYYENDRKMFYKIFNFEVGSINESLLADMRQGNKLADADRSRIDQEYNILLNSVADVPIKVPPKVPKLSQPKTETRKYFGRMTESLKRDGVYLTGEKTVRKVYSKVAKRGR